MDPILQALQLRLRALLDERAALTTRQAALVSASQTENRDITDDELTEARTASTRKLAIDTEIDEIRACLLYTSPEPTRPY